MDPEEAIDAALAQLQNTRLSLADRREVLVRLVKKGHTCSKCGEEDVLCFRCKAADVVGEKAMLAAPLILPQLGQAVKQWAVEAFERRQKKRQSGPGPQEF